MMSKNDGDWIRFGRETLDVEAAAIQSAGARLGQDFVRALELLDTCTGKIVTTGVGKSGIAAKKIAATLTSTGCPAVFLHPSEAMHGDLGIVAPADRVIALSHSGESEELLAILPALLAREVAIIAIVGELNSTLAQRAAVVLDAAIEREACPLNLAPTTSVVVALALGDALAMTLQKLRHFKPEDYALNHPGGRLGRRLTLRVRDVMPVGPETLPHVALDASFEDVNCELTAGHMGAICVLNEEQRLLGIIAESDQRRAFLRHGREIFDVRAADIMNPQPAIVLAPEQLAYAAMQLMTDRPRPISVAPVVNDEGRCIGMLRVNDLVRAGL
jgi:arabinose-5-phosphate isomerase